MASPFGNYSNATLTVSTPLATVSKVNGNWVPATTTASYQAILKPKSPRRDIESGLDGATLYLSGYLTNPMSFPASVKLPTQMPLTITMQNGITQTGIIELQFIPSTGFGVEGIAGQKIEGFFKVQDGG